MVAVTGVVCNEYKFKLILKSRAHMLYIYQELRLSLEDMEEPYSGSKYEVIFIHY